MVCKFQLKCSSSVSSCTNCTSHQAPQASPITNRIHVELVQFAGPGRGSEGYTRSQSAEEFQPEAKISASPRPAFPTRLEFLNAILAAGKHSGTKLFVRPPRPPRCRYSVSLLERQLHLLVVSSPTLMLLRVLNSLRRGGPVYLHHQAKQPRPQPQVIRCLAIPPPRPPLPHPQSLVLRQQCRRLQEGLSPGLARARLQD
jgi:hypothetical protein